jgi:hypothetical protein
MSKHQVGSNDLPPSFDLAKYETIRSFQIEDWCINLEMRVFCAFVIGLEKKKTDPEGRAYTWEAGPFVDRNLASPIFSSKEFESSTGLKKNVDITHVSDLRAFEVLCWDRAYLGDAYKKYIEAFTRDNIAESSPEDHELLWRPVWKVYEEAGIDDEGDAYLKVDLHGTEEKIIADFTAWLRKIKAERQISLPKKKFDDADFQTWRRYKILEYLDLKNWANYHNKVISQHVIGATLFPNEDVSLAERVRKVVIPLANEIGNESFTEALRSQAMAEVAERNPPKVIPGKWDNILTAEGKVYPRKPEQ